MVAGRERARGREKKERERERERGSWLRGERTRDRGREKKETRERESQPCPLCFCCCALLASRPTFCCPPPPPPRLLCGLVGCPLASLGCLPGYNVRSVMKVCCWLSACCLLWLVPALLQSPPVGAVHKYVGSCNFSHSKKIKPWNLLYIYTRSFGRLGQVEGVVDLPWFIKANWVKHSLW